MHGKATHSSKMGNQRKETSLGPQFIASTKIKNETVARSFICSLLRQKNFSEDYANQIANFRWRKTSNATIGLALKHWLRYCTLKNKNRFDFKLRTILDFLTYMFRKENTAFFTLKRCKQPLLEMRKLASMKMSMNHHNYIANYLRACFNEKLPSKREKKLIYGM